MLSESLLDQVCCRSPTSKDFLTEVVDLHTGILLTIPTTHLLFVVPRRYLRPPLTPKGQLPITTERDLKIFPPGLDPIQRFHLDYST